MPDKTQQELLNEIEQLRNRVAALEQENRAVKDLLQAQRERFDVVLRNAPVSISFVRANNGMFTDANPSFEKATGYSREELLKMSATEMWVDLSKRQQVIGILQRQGYVYDFEYDFRNKAGEIRTAQTFFQLLELNGEQIIFGISLDISERKREQAALAESELRYRTLIRNFPAGGILVFDKDLRFTLIDGSNTEITSLIKTQFTGHTVAEILPAEAIAPTETLLQVALAGEETHIETMWWGSHYDIRVLPMRDEQNEISGGVMVVYNINERVAMREELRQAQERLRTVISNTPVILFAFDQAGTLTLLEGQATKILEEIWGAEATSLIGQSVFEVLKTLPFLLEFVQRTLLGERLSVEAWQLGNYFLDISTMPLRNADNKLIGVTGVAVDVTERRRIADELRQSEEQLRLAQRMEAVGRLAGGVAHDFNNLLSAILGYAGLIAFGMEADSPVLADVREIEKAAERAAALTRQLLAFSRRQVLQPVVLNFNEVVQEMDKLLHRLVGETIEVQMYLNPAVGQVRADPSQLEQVLMNLAVNARDAMASSGRLTIETANIELDDQYARQHVGVTSGPYVMLAVSDTGHGIPATTQAHIFEPFFTTKAPGQGTGLGLSTVYGIVKQSGGNIWVYSEIGIGTTFKVYLPRVNEESSPLRPAAGLQTQLKPGYETILLVENEEAVRNLVAKILLQQGYRVLEANNGLEALERLNEIGSLDLLLTDMIMPGLNGQELAAMVKKRQPSVEVLFMSGYTDNVVFRNGLLDADVAFIQKPFTPQALLQRIQQILAPSSRP